MIPGFLVVACRDTCTRLTVARLNLILRFTMALQRSVRDEYWLLATLRKRIFHRKVLRARVPGAYTCVLSPEPAEIYRFRAL